MTEQPKHSAGCNHLDADPCSCGVNMNEVEQPEQFEGLRTIDKPEQPNSNAMIFEQVNGSIKVVLELLEQLETEGTNKENRKQGCIWTLKGCRDNNLKHLQKAFE